MKALAHAPGDAILRAEYWSHLESLRRFEVLLADAATVPDMKNRDWRMRFSEAEAFRGLGRKVEARAAFAALNFDASLSVDVRKRAKRVVLSMGDPANDK